MAGKQITSNIKNKVAVKQIYDYISLEKKNKFMWKVKCQQEHINWQLLSKTMSSALKTQFNNWLLIFNTNIWNSQVDTDQAQCWLTISWHYQCSIISLKNVPFILPTWN